MLSEHLQCIFEMQELTSILLLIAEEMPRHKRLLILGIVIWVLGTGLGMLFIQSSGNLRAKDAERRLKLNIDDLKEELKTESRKVQELSHQNRGLTEKLYEKQGDITVSQSDIKEITSDIKKEIYNDKFTLDFNDFTFSAEIKILNEEVEEMKKLIGKKAILSFQIQQFNNEIRSTAIIRIEGEWDFSDEDFRIPVENSFIVSSGRDKVVINRAGVKIMQSKGQFFRNKTISFKMESILDRVFKTPFSLERPDYIYFHARSGELYSVNIKTKSKDEIAGDFTIN